MATLIDLYGAERALFLSSFIALAIADCVDDGLMTGVAIKNVGYFRKLFDGGLEAGHELPTDEEIKHAFAAAVIAYPQINLTAKGEASASFLGMQRGVPRG